MIDVLHQQVAVQDAYEAADSIAKNTGGACRCRPTALPKNLSRIDNVQELLKPLSEYSEMKIKEEGAERVTLPGIPVGSFCSPTRIPIKDKDSNKVNAG